MTQIELHLLLLLLLFFFILARQTKCRFVADIMIKKRGSALEEQGVVNWFIVCNRIVFLASMHSLMRYLL